MKSILYRKKNKGSALVLVLIATLLILSLSTVALSVSLSNMRMAGKVRDYNSEYYGLEKASQDVLSDLDSKLANAENSAINYMEKELYKLPYDDRHEFSSLKNGQITQSLIHYIWKTNVNDASIMEGSGNVINGIKYSHNLDDFFYQAYNRLFYAYAQSDLLDESFNYGQQEGIKYGYKNIYTIAQLSNNAGKNYDLLTYSETDDVSNQSKWESFGLNTNDFVLNVKIMGTNDEYVTESDKADEKFNGRKIDAVFSIMPPEYEGVESNKYKNRRANPIYCNAITSKGDINFNGSNGSIDGEIISIGNINVNNNSTLNVKGNLCAGKNIVINGSSTLKVDSFIANKPLEIKQSLFGPKLFFDSNETKIIRVGIVPSALDANESANGYYKNGETSPAALPIIFDDSWGGNTYCSSVEINNGNASTEFATRNILYNGKINFTNSNSSKVDIENTLITATSGGTINEGTKVFDTATGFDISAEGATSNGYLNTIDFKYGVVGDILVNPGEFANKDGYSTTEQVLDTYRYENTLQNILKARTKNLGTLALGFSDAMNSHLLATPTNVMEPDSIPPFDVSKFKTTGNGGDLSILKHLKGNTTLELNGKKLEGIIYCNGNLTINGGNGAEISGALICSGSVTINGDVKIDYSEEIIKEVLSNSKVTQEFFESGERGEGFNLEDGVGGLTEGTDSYINTKARVRVGKNRYVITKWSRGKLKGK